MSAPSLHRESTDSLIMGLLISTIYNFGSLSCQLLSWCTAVAVVSYSEPKYVTITSFGVPRMYKIFPGDDKCIICVWKNVVYI